MSEKIKVGSVIKGRTYKREISPLSLITSNEAKTLIGITLRHLYWLVEKGRLHPKKKLQPKKRRKLVSRRKRENLFFEFKEVQNFINKRR